MRIHMKYFGLSRIITGKPHETIQCIEGATFKELVRCLASIYPQLIGNVIHPKMDALQHPNVFHLQHLRFVKEDQWDHHLQPDDRIVLMSLSAGG